MSDDALALRDQLAARQREALEAVSDAVVALEAERRELDDAVRRAHQLGCGPTEIAEATDRPGAVKWTRQRVSIFVNQKHNGAQK